MNKMKGWFLGHRVAIIIASFSIVLFILILLGLVVGSSNLTLAEVFQGLFRTGEHKNEVIIYNIRLPRLLAALIAGSGLAISGAVMQANLKNPMASPTSLGVSNAAVLGANIAIIVLNGGVIFTNHGNAWPVDNPYFTSFIAFIFSLIAIAVVLIIARFTKLNPTSIILIGVAMSFFFSGVTSLIQYYASDIQLSSAIYWSFGDLNRATYEDDLIMLIVIVIASVFFLLMANRYNAMTLGDNNAKSLGINVNLLRVISLVLSSLITSICVSLLGIIGFLGIIAPQLARRLIGGNHKILLPLTMIIGAVILLAADILSRLIMNGISLPVGAITSIIGAPFFIVIILLNRREANA